METHFDADTDRTHEFKLESRIHNALWRSGIARGGTEVKVEVRTIFVGHGAVIEIAGRSSEGKAPGRIKGKVFNNRFRGRLPIPEDVEAGADLWFEAKLPKLGLKAESNMIPAVPQILLDSMEWDRSEVRRGECVTMRASFDRVRGDEEAIVRIMEYSGDGVHHPAASIFARLEGRNLEVCFEFLFLDDTAEIPAQWELQEFDGQYEWPRYFFVVEIDGQQFGRDQESGLMVFKDHLEFQLVDEYSGEPLADIDYDLTLPDGSQRTGKTDGEGRGREDDVPPGKVRIRLDFPDDDAEPAPSSAPGAPSA